MMRSLVATVVAIIWGQCLGFSSPSSSTSAQAPWRPHLLVRQDAMPKADWQPSPHFTPGGKTREIKYVVMHTVEGSYAACISWFKNPQSQVSAHFVVAHDGGITQFVKEEDIAWHAGDKEYNRTSIGIEHEGYADKDLWTLAQYKASASVTRYICRKYKVPADRDHIISHQSITPQRRHDPGKYFNWDLYLSLVKGDSESAKKQMPKDKGRVETTEFKNRVEEWWSQAQAYEGKKNWYEAVQLYRRIVFNVEDETWLPKAKQRLEEILADADLSKGVREEEQRRERISWWSLAETYRNAGFLTDSLSFYDRIIAIYPESDQAKEARKKAEEIRKHIEELQK